VRADSGFFSWVLIDNFTRQGVAWSITVKAFAQIKAAIAAIDEAAWIAIDYPEAGEAQVAETIYVTRGHDGKERRVRLVVRRSRLRDPAQLELWPDWRYHAFITDLDLPVVEMDRFHRAHASVELAIRDLKDGAALEHCPSGRFFANAAWLACAVLAHNVVRWTARLGEVHAPDELTVARTLRTRLLTLPGRLVNRSGRLVLRLPEHWPWADAFTTALERVRSLPMLL
jgi:hypothetical protein